MRLLFVSLAIWAFTFGDVDAAQPEPFSFDCRYLDEHSISGQGIRPRPSKKVIETLQEGSRMKLSYGGKEVIFWISNKGNLVQHLKIIQKNDRLLTAIIKRPINDGATVLALDAETGLMNITVTTLNKGERPGDPDWLVTDVSTYKCQ